MLLTKALSDGATDRSAPAGSAAVKVGATARTAAIYGLVDPREPEHVRYVGSTVQPLTTRLGGHLSDAAAVQVRGWRDEIAPVRPVIVQLAVVDIDDEYVTEGGVAEGPVHDAEYAIVQALSALGHKLLNTVGHTIARHHRGTGGHQGGVHPSPAAGQRALRSGPKGNKGGRCARPDCELAPVGPHAIRADHYEAGRKNGVVWRYCSPGCRDTDQSLVDDGSL
jgi:hypothetical protein